uniref:GPW/gp25 family protein n=1 Tax=Ningiella ruwaisensis TaxID=2364274 RepID=UPI00109FC3B1|nr:GPW/gp25 family protein [Ningiella ruwaisensis]
MASEYDIIGRGWAFPPSFDAENGSVNMSQDIQDIEQSLIILFNTSLGERVMQAKYGCSLANMVQEPLNTQALGLIDTIVRTGILYHEPRIDAQSIQFDISTRPGTLFIDIEYTVRGSNSRFNFVYPFYVNEASASASEQTSSAKPEAGEL